MISTLVDFVNTPVLIASFVQNENSVGTWNVLNQLEPADVDSLAVDACTKLIHSHDS